MLSYVGMEIVSLVFAASTWLLSHYAFSFQRLTLSMARLNDYPIGEFQLLVSPTRMGVLAWFSNLGILCAGGLIFYAYGWILAVIYLVFAFLLSGVLPLFYFKHFDRMILSELQNALTKCDTDDERKSIQKLIDRHFKAPLEQ